MTKLQARIAQLETQLTDRSGLLPGSEAWLHYWKERIGQYLEGGDSRGLTLDILDQVVAWERRQQLQGDITGFEDRAEEAK